MNRKLLVAAVSGALIMPMAAQAVDIAASGHINRALVFSDHSGAADPAHVDGGSSPSRFRFTGSEDLDSGLTVGVNLEYAVWSGDVAAPDPAATTYLGSYESQHAKNAAAPTIRPSMRHAAVNIGGAFGAVHLGQTAPATHLIGHANFDNHAWLSGTELGCDFCPAGGAAEFGGPAFAYGQSRQPIVKYDTPSIGPVALSVSGDGDDLWDVAVRANGEGSGVSYKLHAGYTDRDTETILAAAGAIGFSQGSHFNIAMAQRDPDAGEDTEWLHLGIGHNVGDTSVAATFTDSTTGGGGQAWGAGVGHALGGGTVLYAGYKHLNFDDAQEDYGFFVVGSRITFN